MHLFSEWVEFSPYEIGLPKYGTFMDSELFGSKFFMGKLVKKFTEQPLHFLQGIWGSAFCILFKRLLEDNSRIDPAEMMRYFDLFWILVISTSNVNILKLTGKFINIINNCFYFTQKYEKSSISNIISQN